MIKHEETHHKWVAAIHGRLDKLLYGFSTFALPLVIGLVSIVALLSWKSQYPVPDSKPLALRVIAQSGDAMTPAQALAKLQDQSPVIYHDTQLSEVPLWFTVDVAEDNTGQYRSVEFPSRHAMETSCWDSNGLLPMGSATRQSAEGAVAPVKAGFALNLESRVGASHLLCRAQFIGPARLSAVLWPTSQLQIAAQEFQRNSGLLDGGLIVLAVFVLITALINRQSAYVLFAAWLLINLRMGALSAGWDSQWLGRTIPQELLVQGRLVTITLYYVLTLTLFRTLFKDDLQRVGYGTLVKVAQWTCFPLLALSAVLPFASFLPIFWAAAGLGITLLGFFLGRILLITRSSVAMWYSASIGIALFASFYEVISAWLGLKGLIGAVNSVTAALASSLLASLAIAEQMRQEHKQRIEAQAELEHTFEAMPIGLFTLDLRGQFTSANPALLKMLGPKVLKNGSNTWQHYFSGGAWAQLHNLVHSQEEGELELKGKKRLLSQSEPKRFLVRATLARDKIEGWLQDVTEKSRANEHLQFLANNDPLTKVLNRRGIEKELDRAMNGLAEGRPLALAYLDLDRFKLINDLYGHSAGDEVLQQVCARVTSMLSGELQVGRVGGDEFVIVLPDTKLPLATLICQGLVDTIGNTPYQVGEKAFHVRGSVGLIEVIPGSKIKDAVSTADRACREAKTGQAGALVVYEKNARAFQEHEAEIKLVGRFSGSSATEGLYLEMQPIMSLTAPHDSLNFEVLLRMRDLDGSLIPTDRLISAGESSGRMGVIDRWVLSTTLDWLNTNYDKLAHTKFICMNLNGASLNDEKFLEDVVAMLAKNMHVADHLCYEITESVALHDLSNTRRFIERVRSCGAKVALDDFGAGYTSFSYLKDLPADLLKIDGSFIVNMNSHPANVAIVEAIVNLARNLGMKVIAEWAEDNATVQTLAEIGVDYVQGFAVARPQSPDRLLTAASSASFINNEELASMALQFGKAASAKQVELFEGSRSMELH